MSPRIISSGCTNVIPARRVVVDPRPNGSRDEQTCELLRCARESGGERRRVLWERAISLNLPLADALARRYHDRGEELDDLVQVARLGLVQAVERFDPARGDFSVYAVPTIAGELKRHFRDHSWTVRPPRRIQELQADLSAAWAELAQTLGRAPTDQDLADFLGRDRTEVRAARAAQGCFRTGSLDAVTGAGSGLVERVGCDDPDLQRAELLAVLTPACNGLAPADRELLELRFVQQLTQTEIAQRLGTNQMAVSRRLRRVLLHLRRRLSDAEADGEGTRVSLAA